MRYDIYGVRGEWKHSGVEAGSHEEALVRTVTVHCSVVLPQTPYIVVQTGHPGHGKAKLLKVEPIHTPEFRAVGA